MDNPKHSRNLRKMAGALSALGPGALSAARGAAEAAAAPNRRKTRKAA